MVERLDARQALGAHAALGHGAFRIALDLHHTAVTHVGEHGAAGNAGATRGLDDLHLAGLIGVGRINRRQAVGSADAQRRHRAHGCR